MGDRFLWPSVILRHHLLTPLEVENAVQDDATVILIVHHCPRNTPFGGHKFIDRCLPDDNATAVVDMFVNRSHLLNDI